MPLGDDLKIWITRKEAEVAELGTLIRNLETKAEGIFQANAALTARLDKLESWQASHAHPPTDPKPVDPVPVDPKPVDPPPPPVPADAFSVPLFVRESAGVPRARAFVSTGVPIPQDLNLTDLSKLVLFDSGGRPIAADFRPTAWWRTAKAPTGVQWVQISFFDSFKAGEERGYKLIVAKEGATSRPAPQITASKSADGGLAFVNTGTAMFVVGADGLVDINDGAIAPRKTTVRFDGQTFDRVPKLRRLEIEYGGPLVAYVQVESETDLKFGRELTTRPSIGKDAVTGNLIYPQGSVVLSRRYEFRAGSGVVICQQVVKWEGTKNGTNWQQIDKQVNGILGEEWSETFVVSGSHAAEKSIVQSDRSVTTTLPEDAFEVEQRLRTNRLQPRSSSLNEPTTGGMVVLDSERVSVVFGLHHMDRYESQSIGYSGDEVKVSYASDKFWLGHRQGVQVRSMIAVSDKVLDDAGVLECWAELNHPLRILARDSSCYSVSEVNAIPSNRNITSLHVSGYSKALDSICKSTLMNVERFGTWGLMTYCGWPRTWGNNDGGDEVGWPKTGGAQNWDSLYKEGAFTDYYSSSRSSVTHALMSGDTKWLDLLAFPTAARTLHTQIWCGSPDDKYAYVGWAPTGYAAYRSDMNSSHSYYESVFWYYYLTGDRTAVDILSRGTETNTRSLSNPKQRLAGRFPSQHLMAMRFLKHAHHDPAKGKFFGDSFDSLMARAIKENYLEGTYEGQKIGIWTDGTDKDNPNIWYSLNHYAYGIWDVELLHQYALENPDKAEIVNNIIRTTARTLLTYGPKLVGGDGTVSGKWSRTFQFGWNSDTKSFTNLVNRQEKTETAPSLLFPMDKPGMAAWWVLASMIDPKDTEMRTKAEELVKFSIDGIIKSGLPICKLMGLSDSRLSKAVALLSGGSQ